MARQVTQDEDIRLRPWQRVSVKLTAWVGLCLLGLTSLAAVIGSHYMQDKAVSGTLQTGNWFSETVKRATRYSMLKDQRDNVHQIITTIGEQRGVEAIRVFNKQGRIMFSSRESEIGKMVDMQAEACYGCHYRDRPLERLPTARRSRIFITDTGGKHRVLGIINPIYTEPACYTDPCHAHSPGQKVLGVLDVRLSLAGVDSEATASTRRVVAGAFLIFLAVSGVLLAISYLFVGRPLSDLVGATRRIAKGDYDHPVSYHAADEIGALAHQFERMRLSVRDKTEALEESRRRFQTLFEQVPCYITVQDRDLRLVAVNKMFERDFGEKIGQYCFSAYKGRSDRCPNCAVEKTFSDGRVHTAEEQVTGRDGQPLYFLNITAPILDRRGEIVSVMEMATDVTDIRRLQTELRKSEEKYRLFFNNDPNAIFVFDQRSMEILDANDRATSEYRMSKSELIGRSFLELADEAEQGRVRAFLAEGGSMLPRMRHVRGDGEVFMVNMRVSYGEYLGRAAVIAALADITETLKTEQQLLQAAKMATLGEMSAGVAHELNQPLSVLSTAANILRKQTERQGGVDPELLAEVATELAGQVKRATGIINHLREFGRKSEVRRSRVEMARPISGVFKLLGQQLKVHDIEFTIECPEDLPPVWADSNRLEQVFINLVINARDAIEERRESEGRLAGSIMVTARAEGDNIVVEVADNGVGIAAKTAQRIFEPFFTTKEVGKGTGLGLSISYGIVRDYGGTIEVRRRPEGGSVFRLSLPVAGREC